MTRGEVIRDFSRSLIALATIGGTFLAAYLADMLWVAWLILALAICFVLYRVAFQRVQRRVRRLRELISLGREHAKWRTAAANQQERADRLEDELRTARASSESLRTAARLLGRRDAIAEIVAGETSTDLKLVAATISGETFVLVAEVGQGDDPPVVGGRWFLAIRGLSTVVATFSVLEPSEPGYASLEMVDPRAPDMVAQLTANARRSSEPPVGMVLRRRPIDSITDLLEEY